MEYKRLTDKRLAIPKNAFRQSKSKEEYIELSRIAYKTDSTEIYNRLAELEDKIEQGTLIELPCPIGTIVYYIASYKKKIGLFRKQKYCCTIMEIPFELEMLGTYKNCWFLTREKAEKRLKELQNE